MKDKTWAEIVAETKRICVKQGLIEPKIIRPQVLKELIGERNDNYL